MAHSFTFTTLATTWWLKIYDQTHKKPLNQIFEEVQNLSFEFEKNYSRFIDSSFVSKLNRDKSIQNFPSEFFEMLNFGEYSKAQSLNNFNLAVGGILEDLGYDSSYSFASKSKIVDVDASLESFLVLDPMLIKIRSEIRLDLGGLGKGWLIDKIATYLLENGLKYFSINGGGDIYCTSDHDTPLEFVLENPAKLTQAIGKIQIKNCGLASSAANRRSWLDKNTGQIQHHLINLGQNYSKNFIQNQKLAVFTSGKNGLLSDVASTAIFVAEPEEIQAIAKNFEVEFCIIWSDFSFTKSQNYAGILYQ